MNTINQLTPIQPPTIMERLVLQIQELTLAVKCLKSDTKPLVLVFKCLIESLVCIYVLLRLLCLVGCFREKQNIRKEASTALKGSAAYGICYRFVARDQTLIHYWEDLVCHLDYDSLKGCDDFATKNHAFYEKLSTYLYQKVYELSQSQGLAELVYECLSVFYLIGYLQIFIVSLRHDRKALFSVIREILESSIYKKTYKFVRKYDYVEPKWKSLLSELSEWKDNQACLSFAKNCHLLFFDFIDARTKPEGLEYAPVYLQLFRHVFLSAYAVLFFSIIATVHKDKDASLNQACTQFAEIEIYHEVDGFMQRQSNLAVRWKTIIAPKGIGSLAKFITHLQGCHDLFVDCANCLETVE